MDGVIVADNMSVDGTWEYLLDRAEHEPRLHVGRDTMVAYLQARKMTRLSELARRSGADWIVPFDADEFWFAPEGRLADWLRALDADVVEADWLDMVRADGAAGTSGTVDARTEFLLDATPNQLLGKVAFRSIPGAQLGIGNHKVYRVGATASTRLKIAHARWRSLDQVERKVRQGAAAISVADAEGYGEHWRAGAALGADEIHRCWDDLVVGRPVPPLHWSALGPMLRVWPASWDVWNPDGLAELA